MMLLVVFGNATINNINFTVCNNGVLRFNVCYLKAVFQTKEVIFCPLLNDCESVFF